ncbi:MAG: tetratricopeptide repeat protein [Thermoanaerobaculia bacterium]
MTAARSRKNKKEQPFDLRLPGAVLRIWPERSTSARSDKPPRLEDLLPDLPGLHRLDSGIAVITPEAPDPAPVDTAVHLGLTLVDSLQRRPSPAGSKGPRVLISPGEVLFRQGLPSLTVDAVGEHVEAWAGNLQPGRVHITGWAACMLEEPRDLSPSSVTAELLGGSIPVFEVGSLQRVGVPWRNPELLNRRLRPLPRTALFNSVKDHLNVPAWRVEGVLGCGKSRLVFEVLLNTGTPALWLRARPTRRRGGSLARQIAEQLLAPSPPSPSLLLLPNIRDVKVQDAIHALLLADDVDDKLALMEQLPTILARISASLSSPLYLVVDDVEQIDSRDSNFIQNLLDHPQLGKGFHLLLVGRGGLALAPAMHQLPTLPVHPFDESEMENLAEQLFKGLSLPDSVEGRLRETTQGYPFALEEGMVALIREKNLRRVYGSFFFAGVESIDFKPSARLVCHLVAEAARLEALLPLQLLSAVGGSVPPESLDAAAKSLGTSPPTTWEFAPVAAGLLHSVTTPWGPGVELTSPAYSVALRQSLAPETTEQARHLMGQVLADSSLTGEAHWQSYGLLKGTREGLESLIQTLKTPHAARVPADQMLDTLDDELRSLRKRRGSTNAELEILWRLLPLARKQGRLHEYESELARAVDLASGHPSRLLALAGLKGEMDREAGRYQAAETTIRLALSAAQGADERRQALLLIQLGRLHLDQERFEEAKELFEKLDVTLERRGATALCAACRYHLGNIAAQENRLEEALELHQEALVERRKQGIQRAAGNSLTALGAVYLAIGNYPSALESYREAQELLEEYGAEEDVGFPLLGLGKVFNRLGDYTAASKPLRLALSLRQGKDEVAGEAVARLAVAENHLFLGQHDKALEEATDAQFKLNVISRKSLLADAELLLGRIGLQQRRFDSVLEHLSSALEVHREVGDDEAVGFDLAMLIRLAINTEEIEETAQWSDQLLEHLQNLPRAELLEEIQFGLYRGLTWLRERGAEAADPLPHLQSAYREILRKASHLEPQRRHHFLFQIAEHREILEAGTHAGLPLDLDLSLEP